MATLGDLRARIVLETDRSDIATGGESANLLTDGITRAIEYYQDEDFWFKHTTSSPSTVNGTATVAIPSGLRVVQDVSYNGDLLRKVPLGTIEADTTTGAPSCWAENGSNVRIWPIPDAVYALRLYGVANTAAPTLDADTGIWVNEAQDLICADVKERIWKTFKDYEAAGVAARDKENALSRLRQETRRRRVTPLRPMADAPWAIGGFNIETGDY